MPSPFDVLPEASPADPFAQLPETPDAFAVLPDSAETVSQRIDSDLNYWPSREEFGAYRDARAARKTTVAGVWTAGVTAAKELASKAVDVIKFIPDLARDPQPLQTAAATGVEAVARGTFDLGRSARVLINKLDSVAGDLNKPTFLQAKASALGLPDWKSAPASLQDDWEKQFADYKLDRDYGRFQINRALDQTRESARSGKADFTPAWLRFGEPSQRLTEALSTFTDLSDVASFGAGTIAEAGLRAVTRQGTSGAAALTGQALDAAGTAATAVGRAPERGAAALTRAAGGSDELAETVRKTVSGGGAGLTVAPGVGVSIPGLTQIATAATGAKAAGATATAASEVARAAARTIAAGPSRVGALERLSKDGAAPLWLRKAAANAVALDPALKAASGTTGAAARGALGGAAIGGGLAGVLSAGDPEAIAAGIGGGSFQGGLGGLANRVRTRRARATEEADADLSGWLAGKSADEVANIAALRLTRDQALKVSDVERWARGVLSRDREGVGSEGDIAFRYLNDSAFQKQFGSSQKGAEIIQGEQPVVFINTEFRGQRSLFHEVFHAIDDLAAFDPQRIELNRRLFTETTPDGALLNRGVFDAADRAAFEQSYRERLGSVARQEWDAMPAEQRSLRIRKEIRAESFASMVSGATGREILTSAVGWRRRLTDSLLLADQASTLGRMRQFLETVGVEFKASGDPSELFFKNGRPVTNTPEVDAALRDYIRAKRRITDRLVAGDDDAPPVTFDEHSIRANPKLARALAAQHPDWDGWQKNPDGKVKFIAGQPVLATAKEVKRIELKRGEAIVSALKSVPDTGDVGAMREKRNAKGEKTWDGPKLSEPQIRALEALPDDVLAPSMKERIRQLNGLAGGAGGQIVLDYNAALDKGRYSSAIVPATRIAVPLKFKITKARNFVMDTLDVTHFMRKLGQWQTSKPRAFDAWGGDHTAFIGDVFKYLDNHQRDLPGVTDLDANAAVAIVKRNVIQDLFNIAGDEKLGEVGYSAISGQGGKDNLIRSRRIDRIQRITPGEGSPFPIDYYKQKANFLPAKSLPTASSVEVARVTRDQSVIDFARATGLPMNTGRKLGEQYYEALRRRPSSTAQSAAAAMRNLTPADIAQLQSAIRAGGLNAARTWMNNAVKAGQ